MTLVRVWRRQLMGGMSAAVIVPAALLASLVALAFAGGFGGLTALGQALSGPSAPASPAAGAHTDAAVRPVPAALVSVLSAPATGHQAGSSTAPAAASASPPVTGSGQPEGTGGSPGGHTVPGQAPGAGGPGQAAPRSPAPQPAPKPQPTVADRVVATGTSVTSQVPAPAGSAATKVLQSAGSTIDSIAPIKRR